MPCSEEEALVRFFYNVSASFLLLFLFLRLSSALLSGFLDYIATFSLFRRNQPGCEYGSYSDDDDVEGEEELVEEGETLLGHGCFHVSSMGEADLVADIIHGGEALSFLHTAGNLYEIHEEVPSPEGLGYSKEAVPTEEAEEGESSEQLSARDDSLGREWDQESIEDNKDEETPEEDCDSAHNSVDSTDDGPPTLVMLDRFRNDIAKDIPVYDEITETKEETSNVARGNGRLITNRVQEIDAKNFQGRIENDFEEIFGDSCTVGSTSKSSSEWRSSTINCRDSGTEEPFSSSSRRSCPKWESYTVFQKYDEEMMFLDQISAQKLHETESLRSIKVQPRSISERIVHKITTGSKRQPVDFRNPYHELEAAYVAEICLTWEALNWNYKNFQSKRDSKARDIDPGCPARIAQQFQQFQVLLQRYVENEPYEQGRRPEIYARMRLLAPKLLQVPEYRENEDDADQKEEGFGSRISSPAFLMIMEDGIQTFMNFLKADKVKPCQVIASFFSKKRRGSVDPTLLALMKKVNKKKKIKLKDLRRAGRCIRKRKLKVEEEMEILMGLIDLKLVSRVLRTGDLSEEQLHWCEAKMSKVKVAHGRLQRDSTPLFFPAH